MVIPWLSSGEGPSQSAVGTFVICNLCCLFFVFCLGNIQVQNVYSDYKTFGSLISFSEKCYDL